MIQPKHKKRAKRIALGLAFAAGFGMLLASPNTSAASAVLPIHARSTVFAAFDAEEYGGILTNLAIFHAKHTALTSTSWTRCTHPHMNTVSQTVPLIHDFLGVHSEKPPTQIERERREREMREEKERKERERREREKHEREKKERERQKKDKKHPPAPPRFAPRDARIATGAILAAVDAAIEP